MAEISAQRRDLIEQLRSVCESGDSEEICAALGRYLESYEREKGGLGTNMGAHKAHRAVRLEADAEGLTFRIERHPGWERIQRWRVDFESGDVTLKHEWAVRRAGRFALGPIAQQLAEAIRDHGPHRALRCSPDGRVALIVKPVRDMLSSDGAAKRSVDGRLSRLIDVLLEALAEDWQVSSRPFRTKWTFEPRVRPQAQSNEPSARTPDAVSQER